MRPVDVHAEAAAIRLARAATAPPTSVTGWRIPSSSIWARIRLQPATVFAVLSLVFGSLIIFATPPLRGPDEIAHFLRSYAYARGELLPVAEVDGRKGIFVEPELHNQLLFFRAAGEWFATGREHGIRYGQIMALHRDFAHTVDEEPSEAAVFAPFAGTEGYNPAAYIPYIAAAALGRLLKLDFPDLLLLMRMSGLAAFTAVAAYAIAVTPALKWAFVLIALLPVSLYNRSVLSADGAALSSAMAITALCLAGVNELATRQVWQRSLWMTLCALSKQPQIVFVLLEAMVDRTKLRRGWSHAAVVVLPCLVLSPLWVFAVSADIATWRLQEEGYHPPEHFDPLWKLWYMWEQPLHFPLAAWTAFSGRGDQLWVELIGILGWQDIPLPPWTYLALTALLVVVPLQRLPMAGTTRARVAVTTGLTVLAYVVLVYLIFYLTYTPIDIDHVRGVQGRYFLVALPVAAIFIAAVVNRELPEGAPAAIATAGATVAGAASVGVLLQAYW
jgi:Predicted membrane protein (DUF2142)